MIFFVTSNCNARCRMCFNWERTDNFRKEDELYLDEIKKIFNSFSSIQQLTISGGEPFLRDDLPEILDFISHRNDVQQITIPSNGIKTNIIIKKANDILKRLNKNTQLRIGLSIQGLDTNHDEIVQVKGAFKNIVATYEKLKILKSHYKNLQIGVSICLNKYNKENFHTTLDRLSHDFKECDILITLVRGNPRDQSSLDVTDIEFEKAISHFERLNVKERKKSIFSRINFELAKLVYNQIPFVRKTAKMPTRCYAQSKLIVLQSNGDVYPCEYLNKSLGNIRDYQYSIRAILKSNSDILDFIKSKNCYCTWECALSNNVVHTPRFYPIVLGEVIKSFFRN